MQLAKPPLELKVHRRVDIVGRGMCFVVSMKENHITPFDLSIGMIIRHNYVQYEVRQIERLMHLFGNSSNDNVGLIVKPL